MKHSLRAYYTPGNIIRSAYFGTCDRVIAYHQSGDRWEVEVQECELLGGEWTATGPIRRHATYPDRADRVVGAVR